MVYGEQYFTIELFTVVTNDPLHGKHFSRNLFYVLFPSPRHPTLPPANGGRATTTETQRLPPVGSREDRTRVCGDGVGSGGLGPCDLRLVLRLMNMNTSGHSIDIGR